MHNEHIKFYNIYRFNKHVFLNYTGCFVGRWKFLAKQYKNSFTTFMLNTL